VRILAVTNIYPTPATPVLGTYVEQQVQGLRQIGLEVEVFFVDRSGNGMTTYLRLGQRVAQRVRELQPHLVHIMYGGIMANVVTTHVTDRPVVVSFCGSDLLGEEMGGAVRRVLSGCGTLASRRAARRANGVIVKSKNLWEALPGDVRSDSKVRIIPNGVDLDRFKPLDRNTCRRALGWDPESFHVVFASATGDPLKRPQLARTAVNILQQSSGVRCELHIIQRVPHLQIPVWLNASDVLLLTSLREGSPNIVKEALACDLPVVSVDVGDVKERLEGIEGCYLARPDPTHLAACLRAVLLGQRRVAGHVKMYGLSLPAVAQQISSLYEGIVQSGRKPLGPMAERNSLLECCDESKSD
jgi:teichuronic acid biosynthesis glycosyltransferase TuaC